MTFDVWDQGGRLRQLVKISLGTLNQTMLSLMRGPINGQGSQGLKQLKIAA